MKKILILTVAFFSLLSSCDDSSEGIKFDIGIKKFWAQNFINEKFYQVNAELLARGSRCNVWVEIGSGVSEAKAQEVANAYDNNIYQKMINAFSTTNFSFLGYNFSNIMNVADELTDGDGKLTILLLDIKDGYKKGVNDSYVAGYFWAGNFLNVTSSNRCDMIYIDTSPGVPASKESNMTLAHEMQHLMNFVTTLVKRSKIENGQITDVSLMDTWIDEGLASAAEYVYSGEVSQERVSWFNNNGVLDENDARVMSGSIDKGNNFFVWNNREENQYAVLDDYATVYLFFQWLRLQGGNDIYKKIITSSQYNYNAVVGNINGYSTWDSLLETWLAANFIKNISNKYGYKNEIETKVTYAPTSPTSTTIKLYPGEGAYSLANTDPNVSASGNIVYKYITNSGVGNFSAGSTLLTYNKSTTVNYDEKGNPTTPPDSGTVTGKAPAVSVNAVPANGGRSVGIGNRPIRIDAGDLLRRKGNGESFFINNFKTLKADAVDE